MDNIITEETNFKDLFNAEMLRDLDDLAIVGEVVGEFVEAAEMNILHDSDSSVFSSHDSICKNMLECFKFRQ